MDPLPSSPRRRFRLLELVVVVWLVLLALSLLFPSVCRVRPASNRTATMNNLRYVAIAAINYEYGNEGFPPGHDPKTSKSFYFFIRENIEAETFTDMNGDRARPHPSFVCLTRRTPTTCASGTAPADFGFALSTDNAKTILGGNGIEGSGRVTFKDIKDGPDHSLLLTLISIRPPDYPGRNGVDSPWPEINYGRELRRFVRDTDPEAGDTRLGGPYENGVPCVFAGGSTRMISYDVDDEQMKALWTFNGGDGEALPKDLP
jgi:hypothetical protein